MSRKEAVRLAGALGWCGILAVDVRVPGGCAVEIRAADDVELATPRVVREVFLVGPMARKVRALCGVGS